MAKYKLEYIWLDGYEPVATSADAEAPWWDYLGPDAVSEAIPADLKSKNVWHFTLAPVVHDHAALAERAISGALDEMQRVDRLLSNYQPESELSRMNSGAATIGNEFIEPAIFCGSTVIGRPPSQRNASAARPIEA